MVIVYHFKRSRWIQPAEYIFLMSNTSISNHMKTIIEPFRIKAVEPIHFTTPEQRIHTLANAHSNVFLLKKISKKQK